MVAGYVREVTDEDTPEQMEGDPDAFYDALEAVGRPILTPRRYGQVHDLNREQAVEHLERLEETGAVERFDASGDPVVWYPSEWQRLTDRERVILFPERREVVADQPEQFTRAQLSQFAHLVDTTGSGAYIYEIRREDVWQAPYDSFEDLLSTVRSVLPERSDHLESWMEEQYRRANQFTLRTHDEGYVVLEADSADLMGNVARQELDDGVELIEMETAINEQPSSEWDEATCLWVLQRSVWKHGAVGEAAWERLGELRGFGKQRHLV